MQKEKTQCMADKLFKTNTSVPSAFYLLGTAALWGYWTANNSIWIISIKNTQQKALWWPQFRDIASLQQHEHEHEHVRGFCLLFNLYDIIIKIT